MHCPRCAARRAKIKRARYIAKLLRQKANVSLKCFDAFAGSDDPLGEYIADCARVTAARKQKAPVH